MLLRRLGEEQLCQCLRLEDCPGNKRIAGTKWKIDALIKSNPVASPAESPQTQTERQLTLLLGRTVESVVLRRRKLGIPAQGAIVFV